MISGRESSNSKHNLPSNDVYVPIGISYKLHIELQNNACSGGYICKNIGKARAICDFSSNSIFLLPFAFLHE